MSLHDTTSPTERPLPLPDWRGADLDHAVPLVVIRCKRCDRPGGVSDYAPSELRPYRKRVKARVYVCAPHQVCMRCHREWSRRRQRGRWIWRKYAHEATA